MRNTRIGAALGALVAALSIVAVGGGSAQADPAGCPSLYVLAVPGTWEPSASGGQQAGMLGPATSGLPANVRTDYVTYAATAFPWESEVYARSKKEAVDRGRGMVAAMAGQCPATRVAIIGYSQGADAAGDLAAEIGTGIGAIAPNRVVAVALISDPRRAPADALVGTPVGGGGAGGPRIGGFGFLSPVVKTFCAPGDLYCSTASDDFVTRFAGYLAQTSDPNPANFGRYQQEGFLIFNDLMRSGGLPVIQDQLNDEANEKRREQLEEFYGGGAHFDYGYATSWVHNWLSDLA
ncbi:cutinase family protein [Antrihabitans sp. YC2-6]|uniref:cutinase family protein n=1 Tax=Antrihabitans sp. YC2-6 TaxID=2799498 RepID=UPI0018F59FC7|nr:cutinase family protein [Antrihabitans sp. YC2-6]MBJ8346372.1 cutinase family protein [Antrihabitans sp. YC2-6]